MAAQLRAALCDGAGHRVLREVVPGSAASNDRVGAFCSGLVLSFNSSKIV
jgi:hypothetical protein